MAEPTAQPILYRCRFVLPISSAPIEDGAVLVADSRIVAVGSMRELTVAYPQAAVIDFCDAVLLPPLVNAHTHLELSNFKSWAAAAGRPDAPQDFVDWILWLVRIRRHISVQQFHDSVVAGLKASLLAGTGAIGDILTTLPALPAYRNSPLRGRIFAEVLGHDPQVVQARLTAIEAAVQNPPALSLDWGLSPHAPYTLSAAATDQVFDFAGRLTLPCAMHLAESEDETRFLQEGSGAIAESLYAAAKWDVKLSPPPGCSPVGALCRPGRLRRGDLTVHGVQVDGADVELLKRTGCSLVLCPRSNAALHVGKAPVAAYLEAGVPLALGTDSLASATSLSIWDEMAFARDWFQGALAPRDWLEMATMGGAGALGLQGRSGQLAAGCEASFQVVALESMPGLEQLEEALCSAGQGVKVTHLFLAARHVLSQGALSQGILSQDVLPES